ncbi:MAG TPA: YcgL domain-containing protein [Gammaproteobacteria bacterium]|nr:YcgL domain-containing protein [Gammaproteobacteria bacterium]
MQAFIYRCSNRPDMYIYLAEEDNFENVPKEIFVTLGIVEFAMELEITPETKLAREDTATVLKNLEEKGFHIQLPGDESIEEIMARIAAGKAS